MRQPIPYATITLTLFTVEDEPALLIDPQGDLPREAAAYARLLTEVAAALQRHACAIQPARQPAP